MTIGTWILTAAILVGLLYWVIIGASGLVAAFTMQVLAEIRPPDPPRWPRLSIITPACDEEASLEAAVKSRLDQDYPDLEICLVDDRSTDATPAIVDRIAGGDARVRALHITELPDGWLGKVHALHRGTEMASGEWLLFTDADIHFAPGTLRRVIAHCEAKGLDFLAVMPELWSRGALLDAVVSQFIRTIAPGAWAAQIENPRSSAVTGSGVFNLVRRSVFEKSPGLSWIRLEIADDITFAQMMKRAGARCSVINARGMIALSFYDRIADVARGMEKAGLSVVGGYSYLRLVAVSIAMLLLDGSPWIALSPLGPAWLRIAGAAVLVSGTLSAALVNRRFGRAMWPSILAPVASCLLAIFMLRSGYLAWRRGGIAWRGTLYSIPELRAGVRLAPPWNPKANQGNGP